MVLTYPTPLQSPPPPRGGGGVTWPKKHRKYEARNAPKKFLQGAEADLHCDIMVQFCGATPPPPLRGGGPSLHDGPPPPPPWGGTSQTKGGRLQRGGCLLR